MSKYDNEYGLESHIIFHKGVHGQTHGTVERNLNKKDCEKISKGLVLMDHDDKVYKCWIKMKELCQSQGLYILDKMSYSQFKYEFFERHIEACGDFFYDEYDYLCEDYDRYEYENVK